MGVRRIGFCLSLLLTGTTLADSASQGERPDTIPVQQSAADYSSWGTVNTEAQSDALWQIQRKNYFGDRDIIEDGAQGVIRLSAPSRAENDAIVPIEVTTRAMDESHARVNKIYLHIDVNPMPLAGVFELSTARDMEKLETRVRVNGYTYIRAIAETSDGKLYADKQWIKSRGAGCSAPPNTDQGEHAKKLGNMRFKVNETENQGRQVQLFISHPNNTGMQRDQLSTLIIPQHYIKELEVWFNDEQLMKAQTGFSISENPSFRFVFQADEYGELRAVAKDTKDNVFVRRQEISRGVVK